MTGREKTNAKHANFAARSSPSQALSFAGVCQNFLRFSQKGGTCGGKPNVAVIAEEQLHAKLLLQVEDRLADRRLRHMQAA
jgi:hypothetical protein